MMIEAGVAEISCESGRRGTSQGVQLARPLDTGNGIEMDSPLESPEGTTPAHTLIVRLILTLELEENKFLLL